jgi:hypothetical protein
VWISAGARVAVAALAAWLAWQTPSMAAAFTATASNPSNTFTAGTLATPTGFSASTVCVAQPATGATPTFQTKTTATGSSTSVVLNTPAGTTSGDLLVAQIGFSLDARNTGLSWPLPTGWAFLRDDSMANSKGHSTLIYHIAGSSEPASYTFSLFLSSVWAAAMMRFSGVDTRSPFDAFTGNVGASSTSLVAAGV